MTPAELKTKLDGLIGTYIGTYDNGDQALWIMGPQRPSESVTGGIEVVIDARKMGRPERVRCYQVTLVNYDDTRTMDAEIDILMKAGDPVAKHEPFLFPKTGINNERAVFKFFADAQTPVNTCP